MKWFTPRVIAAVAAVTLVLVMDTPWDQYPSLTEKVMGAMTFNIAVAVIVVLLLKALYVGAAGIIESIR